MPQKSRTSIIGSRRVRNGADTPREACGRMARLNVWKVVTTGSLLLAAMPAGAQEGRSIEATIESRVRSQFWAQLVQDIPDSASFALVWAVFRHVDVREVQSPWQGVRLWKARPRVSHAQEYWVATTQSGLYQLGGFATVEVTGLVDELSRLGPPLPVDSAAQVWIRLLDPFGAVATVAVRGGTSPVPTDSQALRRVQQRQSRRTWPVDAAFGTPDGGRVVQRTMLTMYPSTGARWVPVVHTLMFDREGHLVTWWRVFEDPHGAIRSDSGRDLQR